MKELVEVLKQFAEEHDLSEVYSACSILLLAESKGLKPMEFKILLKQTPHLLEKLVD